MNTSPFLQLSKETLLILPCSGKKRPGTMSVNGKSILTTLDPALASALTAAREALREIAAVDEKTRMPAYLRYSGQLYKHGSRAIGNAMAAGYKVLIVSGGYGVVLADEPIGMYEKRFVLSDWPRGILEGCLLHYARRVAVRSVIAVMSSTTDYAKVIRRVPWKSAGISAALVSPVAHGGVAMVKVPRAQGQAITDLVTSGLNQGWQSSDSLTLEIENL